MRIVAMERRLEDDGHRAAWIDHERDVHDERSDERFDRIAFTLRAIDLLKPTGVRVAVAPARRHLRVEAGRVWGSRSPLARWAVLAVPEDASRRAIALAVASLGRLASAPYAMNVLLGADGEVAEWHATADTSRDRG